VQRRSAAHSASNAVRREAPSRRCGCRIQSSNREAGHAAHP